MHTWQRSIRDTDPAPNTSADTTIDTTSDTTSDTANFRPV